MAAQHHYVSRFLLDGFTDSGTEDGVLLVFDLRQPDSWWSSTSKAARERDLCRVDVPGVSPDAVDHGLGEFEAVVAPIVLEVRSTYQIPGERQLELLLNLIALHTAREPAFRRLINGALEKLARSELSLATATRERWESTVAAMRRDGYELAPTCTWKDMHEFATRGEYTIEPSHNHNVEMMMDTLDIVLPKLGEREWSVVVAGAGAPDFITSDRPVTLRPRRPMPKGMPIGLGMPEVDVLFPISKRAMLVGTLIPSDLPDVADRGTVADLNDAMRAFADRFLFASEKAFVLRHPDGRVVTGETLFKHLEETRAARDPGAT